VKTRASIAALLLGAGAALALAQSPVTWVNFYGQSPGSTAEGPSGAVSMQKTADGGYVMFADDLNPQPPATGRNNCCAIVVTKVDASENVQWQSSYTTVGGGNPGLYPHAILQDGANYLVSSDIVNSAWLIKLDGSGNVLWSADGYSSATQGFFFAPMALAIASDGNYAVAGLWNSTFALAEISSTDGTPVWARTYAGGATASQPYGLVRTADNGYALAGTYQESSGDVAIRVLKTDSSGTPVFDEAFHVAGKNWYGGSIVRLSDNGFAVYGNSQAETLGIMVLRLDSNGGIVWQNTYTSSGGAAASAITIAPDGSLLVAGTENPHGTVLDLAAADGSLIRANTFGSPAIYTNLVGVVGESDGSTTLAGNGGNIVNVGGVTTSTLAGAALIRVGPNGEFTGCMSTERISTVDFTVAAGTAAAETIASGTQTITSPTSAPQNTSAESITALADICTNVLPPGLSPARMLTDVHPTPANNSNVNGVMDPGESVMIEPSWHRTGVSGDLLGVVSFGQNFHPMTRLLPLGGFNDSFKPEDEDDNYGDDPSNDPDDCFDSDDDCEQAHTQPDEGDRGEAHLDENWDETLNGKWSFRWKIHIGGSFLDVPIAEFCYPAIETVLHNGITAGCGGRNYCPDSDTTRAQMAVFILKGEHGGTYLPPACTATVFADVPCPGGPVVDWINQLASEGITGGCGGGNYCPTAPITRAQMAVFLLKAQNGGSYAAPACTGTVFGDVPCPGAQFVNWINQLFAEGITGGCGGGDYCPGNPVTRCQMAVFLTRTFQLEVNAILP
jgi:hypothetical protein